MLLKVISTGSQAGNSYALIADNGEILLLDCGAKYNNILRGIENNNKYPVEKISGILLTHKHGDHLKSFYDFMRNGINCYGHSELEEYIRKKYGEKIESLEEKKKIEVGSWHVIPFFLPHTSHVKDEQKIIPCPNFGYIIQNEEMGTMIYATDMQAIAVSNGEGCLCDKYGNSYVWDIDRFPFIYEETNGLPCGLPNFLTFKNMHINHMLIECNYVFKERAHIDKNKIRHVIRGHHSLENCVGFIKRNKTPDLRNIILCHLSGENADPETMQREIQSVAGKWVNVEVAHAGDEYVLSKYPWEV